VTAEAPLGEGVTPLTRPTPSKRGGKRPGAGRKPRAPKPDERFDVARHVDPKTRAPEWTPELVDRFLQAYLDGRTSIRKACQKTGIPYRAALAYREQNADFAERLGYVDEIYRDVLLEEQQRRALEDPNRPASLIFELKSRHTQYKPATGGTGVRINIGFVDKTFGAAVELGVGSGPPALLAANVTDAEIVHEPHD
jgi:hypothetical protein